MDLGCLIGVELGCGIVVDIYTIRLNSLVQ